MGVDGLAPLGWVDLTRVGVPSRVFYVLVDGVACRGEGGGFRQWRVCVYVCVCKEARRESISDAWVDIHHVGGRRENIRLRDRHGPFIFDFSIFQECAFNRGVAGIVEPQAHTDTHAGFIHS